MNATFRQAAAFLWSVIVLVATAGQTQAGVISRDWKTPGDGLLTYDDVNRREWLDVTESILRQFGNPYYDRAVAETLPGGKFESFTVAKRDDVLALAISARISPSSAMFSINSGPTLALIDLLGKTYEGTFGGGVSAIGLTSEDLAAADFYVKPTSGADGRAGLFVATSNDAATPSTAGLMLYRSVVPEPVSAILAFAVMPLVCSVRRRDRPRKLSSSGGLVLMSAVFVAAMASSSALSAVISRDWKTPGDGLLTYDDVNRREWLDLSETLLMPFGGATTEEKYQNAIAEVSAGGLFEGFTVARSQDVNDLA